MNGERRGMVLGQLELLRALAEDNEREQQLGSLNAYAYPQSLGEWLGTAVQLAGSVSWQAHYALRPLATHADHERRIAEQGRGMIELYGAVLIGALGACDTALEREVYPELEVELPEVESVVEVWDEAREERNGLVFSLGPLGEAIWIYGTCRDRDAALLPTVATKLLGAAGFAALALAVADEAWGGEKFRTENRGRGLSCAWAGGDPGLAAPEPSHQAQASMSKSSEFGPRRNKPSASSATRTVLAADDGQGSGSSTRSRTRDVPSTRREAG